MYYSSVPHIRYFIISVDFQNRKDIKSVIINIKGLFVGLHNMGEFVFLI